MGRLEKLVAFVTGALPGEEVRVTIDARKANYLSAHVTSILNAAPERVASPCPVFPDCGGCQVLHLSYDAQLEWKRRMLSDALSRIGGFRDIPVEPAEPSPLINGTRYRNKVSLVVGKRGAKPVIGFYAARSHRVVPIRQCPVLLPRLNDAVVQFIAFAQKRPQVLHDLRHVVLRTSEAPDRLVLCLSTFRPQPELKSLSHELQHNMKDVSGIVASWNPASENAIFGRRFATLWGSEMLSETVGGSSFAFGVSSFFQINLGILERIAHELVNRLASAKRVVDLFCGVGTFAILLGKRGVIGIGVESQRGSVEQAASNAARNGVTNVAFECAAAEAAVAGVRGHSLLSGADAVIVDPPRRGCDPVVLRALGRDRVQRVEYLSCNPATLARDAKLLAECGYRLNSVKPYDMFPHTGHVEALAEFELQRERLS